MSLKNALHDHHHPKSQYFGQIWKIKSNSNHHDRKDLPFRHQRQLNKAWKITPIACPKKYGVGEQMFICSHPDWWGLSTGSNGIAFRPAAIEKLFRPLLDETEKGYPRLYFRNKSHDIQKVFGIWHVINKSFHILEYYGATIGKGTKTNQKAAEKKKGFTSLAETFI